MTKKERGSALGKVKQFAFKLTSAMTPVADVIMFFKADSRELVVDRLVVSVDEVSANKVTVFFVFFKQGISWLLSYR